MAIADYPNLYSMLAETAAARPDAPAYRWSAGGRLDSVTWKAFLAEVRRAAKSLVALGVAKDDKVVILSYTCYRWVLTDFAASAVGAATVGVYQSLPAKDCLYIADHSEGVLAFAENEEQLAKLLEIRERIPRLRRVVLFSGKPPAGDDWVIGYDRFLALGEGTSDEEIEGRIDAVGPGDLAAIVYTSGTTGVPKGAMLTHDNFVFTSQSVVESLDFHDGDETFLFLPMAHAFARICIYTAMAAGSTTAFARSMETIAEDIRAARPHWFASVPRIYEKFHARAIAGAEAKGGLALAIFRWALRVGDRVSDRKLAGRGVPVFLGLAYALADRLVFRKLAEALGGRLRWCITGAAPLSPAIAKFFHAAGVLVLEGIGMTENSSFTNVNRVDDYRFGWVGRPGPGIEQRIAEDGEILYRGRNVMLGYYKMPRETAETLIDDGWQRTGDLGEIDDRGFLRVTGRKKDLIITAGGKNIAPSAIEGLLATSKYISQVCLVGDRRKYLTALVTVDPETVRDYAREHGIAGSDPSELARHPKILELLQAEVDERNKELASFETVKKITVVDEFTIENGLLTPTLKVKRNVALERFKDEIDAMY